MTTINFAREELKKYFLTMTGEEIFSTLEIDETLFSDHFENYDPEMDDGYKVSLYARKCHIIGSNERAVLLGVYALLRKLGCVFLRPGTVGDGEYIPSLKADWLKVEFFFTAKYRHRGITIEGAVSEENVLGIIDYAPKAGFNSYFIQFRDSKEFFERWYAKKNNPYLKAEDFDIEKIVKNVLSAIKERSLIYHAVGHGWTAEAIGCSVHGWEKKHVDEENPILAMVGGKRLYYTDIPSNTNLCYSQEKARNLIATSVADYAEAHKEIDVLHVWLADDCKNFRECENCKGVSPSDFYVLILNAIDRELTKKGLKTKIAFLAYCELLWPPVKYTIENEKRFILMFAPITRTYTEDFAESVDNAKVMGYEEFFLNESEFPRSLSRNLAFLAGWKRVFKGDSFIFDYPLMWDINRDFSSVGVYQSIAKDVDAYKKAGLNGDVSCQLQRVFFPHGLTQTVMGLKLLGEIEDLEKFSENYLLKYYGNLYGETRKVMEEIKELIPMEYFRFEIPCVNFALSKNVEKAQEVILNFKALLDGDLKEYYLSDFEKREVKTLKIWAEYLELLFRAIHKKTLGLDLKEEREKAMDFLCRREMEIQPLLDVCYVIMGIGDALQYAWDKSCDEDADKIKTGTFAKQIDESLVLDKNGAKLRYKKLLKNSFSLFKKGELGRVEKAYIEGKDYVVDYEKGIVYPTENTSIPDFSKSAFYGLEVFNHNDFEKWGNGEFMVFADYKYYAKENDQDTALAKRLALESGNLGAFLEKVGLYADKQLKITLFGDSISVGGEATAESNTYIYRFIRLLQQKTKEKIIFTNRSVGGDSTKEAMARYEKDFEKDDSDVAIVAFGMNDQNSYGGVIPVTPEIFEENLRFFATDLQKRGKYLVFVTPCIPNTKWFYQSGRMDEYVAVIKKIAKEFNSPLADLNALWKVQLEKGKRPEDLLNNGINHPTDYGHYLYFLALKQLIS